MIKSQSVKGNSQSCSVLPCVRGLRLCELVETGGSRRCKTSVPFSRSDEGVTFPDCGRDKPRLRILMRSKTGGHYDRRRTSAMITRRKSNIHRMRPKRCASCRMHLAGVAVSWVTECPRLSDEQNLQNANVAQMYLSHDVHRVINVWNDMPTDTVDFTSLTNVKKSIRPYACWYYCTPEVFSLNISSIWYYRV